MRPTSLDSIGSALVDLDGDNKLEILVSSGDGVIHAFRHDGSELPGWPVRTDDVEPLPLAQSDAFDGDPANGEIAVVELVGGRRRLGRRHRRRHRAGSVRERVQRQGLLLGRHGTLEPGFPVETDKGITRDQYTGADELNAHGDAVLAPPALEDLDGDGTLELAAGAFDQKMYVWNHDGTRYAPWPKAIFDAGQVGGVNTREPEADPLAPGRGRHRPRRDDGARVRHQRDLRLAADRGSGRMYAYEADGSLEPGWPVEVGPSPAPSAVPVVADGAGTSPVAADIDGDGTLEIAIGVLGSPPLIFNHDGTQFALMNSVAGTPGGAGDDGDEETPEGGSASSRRSSTSRSARSPTSKAPARSRT